ncbi:MAG: Fe-S oxidoreductase, partial [Sedimentibacter sp.]|nr:Fe-S oxidoreductase [Sedimentibacter sp.]
MKILLIRPKPNKETIGLQHVMICEPLEFEYLVSNVPEEIKSDI